MTPHNNAKKGEIAKTVIMPGDPKRAKFIAEHFLKDVKLVNDVRYALCYTGTYKDKKVSVMASGMGMPSMSIYSYELFKFYDVDNIIRIGSCQSRRENIKLNDIILATEAYTDSNFAHSFDNSNTNKISSSNELNNFIARTSLKNNILINQGPVFTSDVFYKENETLDENMNKVLGLEMETFALLYIANKLNKNATSILTVSDSIYEKEILSPEEREKSFKNAIILVLESIN